MRADLTRRERQILEVVYRLGEATANQIQEAMPGDVANATVRTQLRMLEDKGVLSHRRDGKRFVYRASEPRQSAAVSALRKVVDVFFAGSVEEALAAHLADPKTRLSDDEIRRLRQLLNQHRERGKGT